MNLLIDYLQRVGANCHTSELEAGHFTLEAPFVTINIEYSAAEEVAEDGREGFSLGVVVEVGL